MCSALTNYNAQRVYLVPFICIWLDKFDAEQSITQPQTNRAATRTSTRSPHPLHPAPCPYRTGQGALLHLVIKVHQDGATLFASFGRYKSPGWKPYIGTLLVRQNPSGIYPDYDVT
jgi:hypothetical protein